MALEFDSQRAPRKASELLQLVRAVRGASAADETDWLEWKSTLELRPQDRSDKSGLGHVARAIIAFANRMPDAAVRHVEGFGYFVVGADPEGFHGVLEHDSVQLEDWISPYVGDIDWVATYVRAGDEGQTPVHVLVVTVYPPQWGDPVRCMRKEAASKNKGIAEATVFVRRRGTTARAKAEDIDRLCGRLLRREDGAGLDMKVTALAGGVTPVLLAPEALEAWLACIRSKWLAPLEKGRKTAAGASLNDLLKGLTTTVPDPRSAEEYQREVEHYLAELREQVPGTWEQAAAVHAARLQLRLHNCTGSNLAGVQLELELPSGIHAVLPVDEDEDDDDEVLPFGLPSPPRFYGPREKEFAPVIPRSHFHVPNLALPSVVEEPEIRPGPPVRIDFPGVHLRPQRSMDLDDIVLISDSRLTAEEITMGWQATSTTSDGAAEGTLTIPVLEPVSLIEVIRGRI